MKIAITKKNYVIATLLVVVVILVIWHFSGSTKDQTYRVETARIGNITQTVTASGTLNPVILVNVGTQVSGTVQKIYADFNDRVTAGQVLLELDPKLFNAALMQSLAAIKKAKATLELAKANEKRGGPLYAHGDISRQDWDTLIEARKTAEADLGVAIATAAKDKTNLDYATIHSPVAGVVVDREVDVGQTVAASFQTPVLYKIAQDLSKMQIDSSFAEADIGNIRPEQEATFTVDAYPNRNFKGVVKQIRLNPTMQQNVVTYDVVVGVDNHDGVLLPGMTAYVSIKTAEHKNVLLVPSVALRFHPKNAKAEHASQKQQPGSGVVYKMVDGQLSPVVCKIGLTDNKNTEIVSGDLKAGDAIVVGENQESTSGSTNSFRIRAF